MGHYPAPVPQTNFGHELSPAPTSSIRRRFIARPSGGHAESIDQSIQTEALPATPAPSTLTVPQRAHVIRTRSMDGIYIPKVLMTTRYLLPTSLQATLAPPKPICYSQTIKTEEWRAAMALEFDALQHQGTSTLVL